MCKCGCVEYHLSVGYYIFHIIPQYWTFIEKSFLSLAGVFFFFTYYIYI